MGNVNSVPVISQAKSTVQAIAGDTEGAKETQKDFLDTCPVISQGKSLYHWLDNDEQAARETQVKFGKGMSDLADGIPVVGHIKGGVHYACGDVDGGDSAMKSASRTVGVIGGGIVGGVLGGPVGAVAGGIAGGAALDGITTGIDSAVHDEFRPAGQIAVVNQMINGEASVGNAFDLAVGVAIDGVVGNSGVPSAAVKEIEQENSKAVRVKQGKEPASTEWLQKHPQGKITCGIKAQEDMWRSDDKDKCAKEDIQSYDSEDRMMLLAQSAASEDQPNG